MGSKNPKKSDYQPSESDKAAASIALQRYNQFKTKYQPVLIKMRDKAMQNGTVSLARGRGNADAMQALTANMPTPQMTAAPDTGTEVASGLAGQLGRATKQGRAVDNELGSSVLAMANQQAGTATQGLSALARIETSDALAAAQRKQQESAAKWDAALSLGSAALSTGLRNKNSGGKFFTPVGAEEDEAGNPILDGSLKNRFKVGMGRVG